jgi:hypothetical protein
VSDITNIVTPAGIAVWPRLNKPDTKFVAEGEYSVRLKLNAGDEKVLAFLDKVEAARHASQDWARKDLEGKLASTKEAAKVGALKKKINTLDLADSPVKPVLTEDGGETGFVEIRFKCKAQFTGRDEKIVKVRPALVGPMKETLDPEVVEVGGGSTIKVSAAMYPYYNAKDNVSGVTFRLRAAQILKLSAGANDYGFSEEDEDETGLPTSPAASETADF